VNDAIADRCGRLEVRLLRIGKPEDAGEFMIGSASNELLARGYDIIAPTVPFYREVQVGVADVLADAFAHHGQARRFQVVELGTGTGATALSILVRNKLAVVTGIDHNPTMLEQASVKLKALLQEERVTLREADALDYLNGMDDEQCDAVASAYTVHNWNHDYRQRVGKDVLRVLKPGGLFVNGDKYADDDPKRNIDDLVFHVNAIFEGLNAAGKEHLIRNTVVHYIADQSPSCILSEATFIRQLTTMGYCKVNSVSRFRAAGVVAAYKPGK